MRVFHTHVTVASKGHTALSGRTTEHSARDILRDLLFRVWEAGDVKADSVETATSAYMRQRQCSVASAISRVEDTLKHRGILLQAREQPVKGKSEEQIIEHSPWQKHILVVAQKKPPVKTAESVRKSDAQLRQSRWSSTSRADRWRLLSPDLRELAIDLACSELDHRRQRQTLSKLSRLNLDDQEKVLQCSKSIKEMEGAKAKIEL